VNSRPQLSDRALATCKAHWFGHKDDRSCRSCHIITACHAHCAGGQDALTAHIIALNTAAETAPTK